MGLNNRDDNMTKTKGWIVPTILLLLIAIFAIIGINTRSFDAYLHLGVAIMFIISLIIYTLFSILNKFIFKIEMNWWKYILAFFIVMIVGFIIIVMWVNSRTSGVLI